jgi:hypothetical protein
LRGKTYASVVLLVALCLVGGCSKGPDMLPEDQSIRSTISRYDELLANGYRSLDMNQMREVASQTQAEAEYVHMSSLAEGGLRLDPQLRSLEFVRVSIEATSAQAETRETWDYRHFSRATGALVAEQKGLVYHLAWDLSRESSGGWLVTDVRAISATTTVPPTVVGTTSPPPAKP